MKIDEVNESTKEYVLPKNGMVKKKKLFVFNEKKNWDFVN